MTGEKVRDIGVAAGVGQWAKQGVNGVRDLEGAGGGDWRPTQRMPPARAPLNHVPTVVPRRRRRAARLAVGAGSADGSRRHYDDPDWGGPAGRSVRRYGG